MAVLHRIFLKGPWEYEFVSALNSEKPRRDHASRLPMPAAWTAVRKLAADAGASDSDVRFIRPFHCPTNVDKEQVWIVVAGLTVRADVLLNGEPLGSIEGGSHFESDISTRLKLRNQLELRFRVTADRAHGDETLVWKSVALEMRTPG